MAKTVKLGNRLRYPITVVKLHKRPGDKIRKQETLMEYSFKWMKEVGDTIRGETWQQEQTTIVTWDSPSDGELTRWFIREGQHIASDSVAIEVKEECSHDIQFQGLCGMCGKDMTEVNWATETRDTARAPINMVHDQTNLTVSENHAQRTEHELQRRLLVSRKLSLVVDLDQTIIQACIDPTVGEWQNDPTNPNYEAVKGVKSFQLDDGPTQAANQCSYYIKMRPGLESFLKRIAQMYELHVYTMGTRAYAQNVARVVDPDKKLFGNRVISRDENGSIYAKDLQRLFPISTHMVAIIDDRSDVWPNNRANLIKVSPYEFFKGIGDINSSLLPKRHDLLSKGPTANGTKKRKRNEAAETTAAVGDSTLTEWQVEEQKREFEKQIKDRPLQALQEKLDKEDEEAEKATVQSEDGSESRSSSPPSQRHRVLQDDDDELEHLQDHLTALHRAFYAEYDSNRSTVPDAGQILDEFKAKVLQGKKIVLSGVLPRGIDIYGSEIGLQIMSFGADLRPRVTKDITHLVVNTAQPGREKLLEARRRPHVKIVSQEWLAACFTQWAAVDEAPYMFTARLIEEDNAEHNKPVISDEDDEDDDKNALDKTTTSKTPNGTTPTIPTTPTKLRLVSPTGETHTVELKPDEADDGDDDGEGGDEDEDDAEPGLLPSDLPDGATSPIDNLKAFNWATADDELAEFLASGSEDEDEDDDGDDGDGGEEGGEDEDGDVDVQDAPPVPVPGAVPASASASVAVVRKRKGREEEEEEDDEDHNAGGDGDHGEGGGEKGENGAPAKRLRRTDSQRGSSLRNLYVATTGEGADDSAGSGLPTPGRSDGQDVDMEAPPGGGDDAGAEEDDEEIDFDVAELEAEFEAEFDKAELEAQMAAEQAYGAEVAGGNDTEKG
jgi:RNA polymerase II subunit A-like phosphatase